MKALIIYYPNFERGGVKINFINFLKILKNLDFKKYIITDTNISKSLLGRNIRIFKIPTIKIALINHKVFSSLISTFAFVKLLIKLRKIETRIVSFQSSFFISILCFLLKKKLIIRVSEDPIEATNYADTFFLNYIVFLSKIITYNFAHTILANSTQMKKNISRMCFNKKKIKLLFNMNIKKINKNIDAKKKNIFLSVGRLCKQKNQSLMIKSFNYFNKFKKNFILLVIGDGPDRQKLQKMVDCYKLNRNIKILGWKNNIKKYYDTSRYFILPSLYEGLPNALIDALNSGLIALSTNVSGVKDIYGNNFISIDKTNYISLGRKMIDVTNHYQKNLKRTMKQRKNLKIFLNSKLSEKYIKILFN